MTITPTPSAKAESAASSDPGTTRTSVASPFDVVAATEVFTALTEVTSAVTPIADEELIPALCIVVPLTTAVPDLTGGENGGSGIIVVPAAASNR